MSHLDHVVNVKKTLISKGITSVEDQKKIIAGAYIRALIVVTKSGKINSDDRRNVLTMWNEITPIPLHLIDQAVAQFFLKLSDPSKGVFDDDKFCVRFVPKEVISEELDEQCGEAVKLEGYQALIETLISEATAYVLGK